MNYVGPIKNFVNAPTLTYTMLVLCMSNVPTPICSQPYNNKPTLGQRKLATWVLPMVVNRTLKMLNGTFIHVISFRNLQGKSSRCHIRLNMYVQF